MPIKGISIENFTVFEKIEIGFCDGINVFIGENGFGKTHLLKILYAFCECKTERDKDGLPIISVAFDAKLKSCFQGESFAKLSRRHNDLHVGNSVSITIDIPGDKYSFEIIDHIHDNRHNGLLAPAENKQAIPSVFIPAKEMLTHAKLEKDFAERNLPFDATMIDILNKAGVSTVKQLPDETKGLLNKIAHIIGGKVVFSDDRYFIDKGREGFVQFSVEAEGFKKLGLIYRLIETGHLQKGSVLLWDEPEANINPKLVPVIVDILLELSRIGVQIYLATHDYTLAKYFEVKRKNGDAILFHSLYKTQNGVICESNANFADLKENAINTAFDVLMDEVINRNLGD